MSSFGDILKGILTFGISTQLDAMKKQQKLAEQQMAMQKQQFEIEQQQYNKANQKEVDVEGLLSDNSGAILSETQLTGARGLKRNSNPLNSKNKLLGGS